MFDEIDKDVDYKKVNQKVGPILTLLMALGGIASGILMVTSSKETEQRFAAIEDKVGIKYDDD